MHIFSYPLFFSTVVCFFFQNHILSGQIQVQPLDFPAQNGKAIQLVNAPSGTPYAIWVENYPDRTQKISFTAWEGDDWTSPQEIFSGGPSIFSNWIERPQLQFFGKRTEKMAASWLISTDRRNSYSHDIQVSISTDGGMEWSAPQKPYKTKIPAYFGLTQMAPIKNDQMLIVWQDGRNTVQEVGPGKFYPRMGQLLNLHSATFDINGQFQENEIFKDSISQLSPFMVQSNRHQTILSFWKDRGNNKKVTSRVWENNSWSNSKMESTSSWALNFAPMDSPKTALFGKKNALLWQQEVKGEIQLFLKVSKGGKTILESTPIELGANYFGRFQSIWANKKTILITWLSGEQGAFELWAAYINKAGVISDKTKIMDIPIDFPSLQPQLASTKTGVLLSFALSTKESQEIYSFLLRKD